MRRLARTAVPMMLAFVLLSGCGDKSDKQTALDFRTKLLGDSTVSYTAEISADYGDRVYAFTLNASGAPGGETDVTVAAPEEIAGIAATVDADCVHVRYPDVSLEFGTMADGFVAPICLPSILNACWTSGYIDSSGEDDGKWLVAYRKGYEAEELLVRCWFDEQIPVYAEISYQGDIVLTADLSNFLEETM
ncbi:MAG: hypothetical protein PHS97_00225 [Oscillospiraceae bacterium]|nr:hypothetical protein [Oscillospiraceae bacterium]